MSAEQSGRGVPRAIEQMVEVLLATGVIAGAAGSGADMSAGASGPLSAKALLTTLDTNPSPETERLRASLSRCMAGEWAAWQAAARADGRAAETIAAAEANVTDGLARLIVARERVAACDGAVDTLVGSLLAEVAAAHPVLREGPGLVTELARRLLSRILERGCAHLLADLSFLRELAPGIWSESVARHRDALKVALSSGSAPSAHTPLEHPEPSPNFSSHATKGKDMLESAAAGHNALAGPENVLGLHTEAATALMSGRASALSQIMAGFSAVDDTVASFKDDADTALAEQRFEDMNIALRCAERLDAGALGRQADSSPRARQRSRAAATAGLAALAARRGDFAQASRLFSAAAALVPGVAEVDESADLSSADAQARTLYRIGRLEALAALGEEGTDAAELTADPAADLAADKTAITEEVLPTLEAGSLLWVAAQNALGAAELAALERGDDDALGRATLAFERAVSGLSVDSAPAEWAVAANNLGAVSLARAMRGDRAALTDASALLDACNREDLREDDPVLWAVTQCNLALARTVAGVSGDAAAGARAPEYARAALGILKRPTEPTLWALAQQRLGLALLGLGSHGDTDALAEATVAFDAAQTVMTREDAPNQWAGLQVYHALVAGEVFDWHGGTDPLEAMKNRLDTAAQVFEAEDDQDRLWEIEQHRKSLAERLAAVADRVA